MYAGEPEEGDSIHREVFVVNTEVEVDTSPSRLPPGGERTSTPNVPDALTEVEPAGGGRSSHFSKFFSFCDGSTFPTALPFPRGGRLVKKGETRLPLPCGEEEEAGEEGRRLLGGDEDDGEAVVVVVEAVAVASVPFRNDGNGGCEAGESDEGSGDWGSVSENGTRGAVPGVGAEAEEEEEEDPVTGIPSRSLLGESVGTPP